VVIALRHLIVRRPSGDTEVPIRLFQPEEDNGAWICRYEIDWPSRKQSGFGAGVDSIQALILALKRILAQKYIPAAIISRSHSSGLSRTKDTDFPFAPMYETCSRGMT
jgi:hypothetical protein